MKTTAQLIVVCGVAVLVGLAVLRSVARNSVMASQSSAPVSIARADGPLALGAQPTRVRLISSAGPAASIAGLLTGLGHDQRLLLVLRRVSAERPPGVLFQIFLDLPGGGPADGNSLNYVGTLNFFRALPGANTGDADVFESFDITDVARAVAAVQTREDFATVTVAAVGRPADDSRPRIGSVEIVRQ